MKILLVVPKYTYKNFKPVPNYNYTFPIGLSYISAILKKEKFDYDCLNMNHESGTVEEIINRKLDSKKYDIICTGDMALGYPMIEKIINISKKHSSHPKVILGGAMITCEPDLITNLLNFDIGVIGEGEITIVELLKCLEKGGDLKKINGLCWKEPNGELVFTKPRPVIDDVNTLPFPDYESLGFSEYLENMSCNLTFYLAMDYPRTYILFASRGCPYQCTFCYHSLGPKYRYRSVDNLMTEVDYAIKKYNINSIWIIDDLFAFSRERILDFCKKIKDRLKKESREIKWGCQLAVNSVDKNLLSTMKDAGCTLISFGFESYSQKILNSMKKPITPEQIKNAIKWCLELQITLEGGFIFGDSAETKETAKETLDFWKKECCGQLKVGFIQPYPLSEMYLRAIKKGVIKDKKEFMLKDIYRTNFFNMTDSMSDEEFKELVKAVLRLGSKYGKYAVPIKIIKEEKEDRYELITRCPHCNAINKYKNVYMQNSRYFTHFPACRHCTKRFFLVSKLYKFTNDNYWILDPLRRAYLSVRKKIVDMRV